jgi:DNA helicase-2/ATP-dependent DNA helicase PcrA
MERLDDLEQFALFAESSTDLKTFLDEVSLTETFGARGPEHGGRDDERIVLSTIHQAKGLEWDTVFILGLTDTAFPNPRALEEDGGLEEERRLFYVAATRARRRLFLTYAITSGFDTLMMNQPSTFVREIPPNICEEVRLKTAGFGGRGTGFGGGWSEDESTIVLDDAGERIAKKAPRVGGFLRSVDEL